MRMLLSSVVVVWQKGGKQLFFYEEVLETNCVLGQ